MVRPVIRVPFADDATTQPLPQPPAFGMVTTKMSKAPSLLFDLDDAGDTLSPPDSRRDIVEETAVAAALKRALEPRTETEYMLALHVRIAREEASKRGGDGQYPEIGELADTFRRMGYPVKVRTALGGGWGGACLRNLRHTFLAVSSMPSTQSFGLDHHPLSDGTLLIDPRFKEQFEIAHTTPRYQHLLATVPVEVVAPPARIAEAVNILCAEMALAFHQCGVPLPPWRQVGAMITKWQPRKSEDVDLTARVLDAGDSASAGVEGKRKNNPKAVVTTTGPTTTGPTTVAQKLAMLGVFPTPPPYEKPSPISEGFEEASNSDNDGKGPEIDAGNEFQFMIGPSGTWGSRGITDASTQSTSPSSRATSHEMDGHAAICRDGDDSISTKGDEGDEDDHGLLFSPQ
jgi:uncharacterized protein (TIGR01615 family)